MTNIEFLKSALTRLVTFIESEGFKGYDPYDALNCRLNLSWTGKWGPVFVTQLHKRNPVNLRKILGIQKQFNPKGMGLLLEAYAVLHRMEPGRILRERMDFLYTWLCENYSKGYSGMCWGYNFDWASPERYLKAHTPSIVVTATAARGIYQYYLITKRADALSALRSACDFILNDLPRVENKEGVCFSYTPIKKECCYNASMLGVETLIKTFSITHDRSLADMAQKALDFTLVHQKKDGHWNYSRDLISGRERELIDFHQGFILDVLSDFIQIMGDRRTDYITALEKGLEYYKGYQFFPDGRSIYRLPRAWPKDIHNQAQGIITFAKCNYINAANLEFAHKIALWTINHMQDKKGYFYYQKHRVYTNKIPYMRWAQAWMMVALTQLLALTETN